MLPGARSLAIDSGFIPHQALMQCCRVRIQSLVFSSLYAQVLSILVQFYWVIDFVNTFTYSALCNPCLYSAFPRIGLEAPYVSVFISPIPVQHKHSGYPTS